MTDFALRRPIAIGEKFSQDDVEGVFETNFGYQFKGITLRSTDEGKYIILLSNEGEIYNDEIGADPHFTYEGEGRPSKGDQKKTPPNKALIQSVDDLLPIYLFTSIEGEDEYEFRGLVDVHGYQYVSDGTRMRFRFQMERLNLSSWEEFQNLKDEVRSPIEGIKDLLETESKYEISKSRARSAVFSRKVKEQYGNSCAVCGRDHVSPEGNPEVESAHIYPKSEGGADRIQNGMALCRYHHWAYDCGWFSVSDDRTVIVRNWGENKPPAEIQNLEGEYIKFPKDSSAKPPDSVLAAHRELHGFTR